MPRYRLIMADGTECEVGLCGAADGVLWIQVYGMTMIAACTWFGDPEKTREMIYDTGNFQDTFTGYTDLFSVQTRDDFVSVGIKRE